LNNPPMTLHEGRVDRTIAVLAETLDERGDRFLTFSARTTVRIP